MVCQICTEAQIRKPHEDCFKFLLSMLKAHYEGNVFVSGCQEVSLIPFSHTFPERVEECHAKDKEIEELKKTLSKTTVLLSAEKSKSDAVADEIGSPTLFSETYRPNNDTFPEVDDTFLDLCIPGQRPVSCSSPIISPKPIEAENQSPNIKKEDSRPFIRPAKKLLEKGWKSKPSRLSFSNMNDQTQINSPKKPIKTLTVKECFRRSTAKVEAPKVIVATIDLDDEEPAEQKKKMKLSPNSKYKALTLKTTKRVSEPETDLEGFCDECSDVSLSNFSSQFQF